MYIGALIEIYNWRNKNQVYETYEIIELEKYLILKLENHLNLKAH